MWGINKESMKTFSKIPKTYIFLGILVLLAIISFYKLSSPKTSNNPTSSIPSKETTEKIFKLEREEGNVTVIVEYLPEKSDENSSIFLITLDTHSVDLDAFDFQKDVFLGKEGRGSLPIKVSQSGSGHHRKAEVAFKKTATPFSIVLSNLGGISKREFQFTDL